MNISIIVAVAENLAIGKNNKLLWHISEDLKRFKKLTLNCKIIMGRKTFYSLPNGALPKRHNVVITRNKSFEAPNCTIVHSVEEALSIIDKKEKAFIIGGSSIYKAFLNYADTIFLTKVYKNFEADAFFPVIDNKVWTIIKSSEIMTSKDKKYSYITYKKRL